MSFADAFESGDISAWTGQTVSSGNSLSVETEQPYSGSYSLKCVRAANAGSGATRAQVFQQNIGDGNDLYADAFVRVASGYTLSPGDRFSVLEVVNSGSGVRARAILYYDGSNLQWHLWAFFGSGNQETGDLLQCNADQWYQVKLRYTRRANFEEARLWIGGTLRGRFLGSLPQAETINYITAGFKTTDTDWNGEAVTLYVDQVTAGDYPLDPKKAIVHAL